MRLKRKEKSAVEVLAMEYCQINEERLQLERRCRFLHRRLQTLRDGIQEHVGIADLLDVPLITHIGKFFITQIRKHRIVEKYECDFVEFKVIETND